MTDFVLWGFHPAYTGRDGNPYLIKLAVGNARSCGAEARHREHLGGWTMHTYKLGDAPEGLRLMLQQHLTKEMEKVA